MIQRIAHENLEVMNGRFYILLVLLFLLTLFFLTSSFVSASESEYVTLIVKKGDNLNALCIEYLEDPNNWPKVARYNKLKNPNLIFPQQEIKIPVLLLKGVPTAGIVTFIKGEVAILYADSKTWKSIENGEEINEGGLIKTGANSGLEITYDNGISVILRDNTKLKVTDSRSKSSVHHLYRMFLNIGRAVTNIKKDTGINSRFEIRSPSAVAAARGTEFRVAVDQEAITRCEVMGGKVAVAGQGAEVTVSAGKGTVVSKGKSPLTPKKLLPPPIPLEIESLYRSMPVSFSFSSVQGAEFTRAMMSRTPALKDIVRKKVLKPGGSLQILGVDDGTYYLHGRSIDKFGLEGLAGELVAITVRVNPLPPFVKTPENHSEHREKSINLSWLKVEDAVKYHLQIAVDPEFSNIIKEETSLTSEKYQTEDLGYASYFFRLSSIADDGYQGIWSDVVQFDIIPPPPAPSVEPLVENDDSVVMKWRNLGAGITYHVQVSSREDFDELLVDEVVSESEMTIKKPEDSGTYYVRTSGVDSEGYEGAFSKPQTFKVKAIIGAVIFGVFWTVGGLLIIL